ncbi:hypothetical protein EJ06DRAFT_189001 [Trichodelitschia bisporula]|uniref:Fork-head domain-containing protein n=1 Tax=Trichodelitschia bisporula TaxID=703511 RepID=A0A6G1I765_9PEZI|nr:hypothetical protein EJ06DRAFT_189001 [Trichodelitschia bisporula]
MASSGPNGNSAAVFPSSVPRQRNLFTMLPSADVSIDAEHHESQHSGLPKYVEDLALLMNGNSVSWPSTFEQSVPVREPPHYQICPPPAVYFQSPYQQPHPHLVNTPGPSNSYNVLWPSDPPLDLSRPRSIEYLGNNLEGAAFPPSAYQLDQRADRMPSNLEAYTGFENQDNYSVMQQQRVMATTEPGPSLQHSPFMMNQDLIENKEPSATPFDDENEENPDSQDDRQEPYAKSIFRCLQQAPNHTMVLRDIYEWFKEHTDKGRDPNERGWQNSIRHNLSMNKAFEKIELPAGDDAKRGYQWRLSAQALREGRVQSTTRYRNKQPNKRGSKSHNPAPHRQASGAKGGEMARKAAALRRSERLREIRHSLTEAGAVLRSRGVIRGPGRGPVRAGTLGSPGRGGVLGEFTSEPLTRQPTPYFVYGDENPYAGLETPAGVPDSQGLMLVSCPSSPDVMSQPEYHFVPAGERLFYDSPETVSEPRTPRGYGEGRMDASPFINGAEGMEF